MRCAVLSLALAASCLAASGCGAATDEAPLVDAHATAALSAPDFGPARTIRWSWPAQPGQRGRLTASSEEVTTKRVDPATVEPAEASSRRWVKADGIYEVTRASDDGNAEVIRLSEASVRGAGADHPAIDVRDVTIVIERAVDEDDATVTVNGRPADASLRDALGEVISLAFPESPGDDDVFGTRVPRHVGARWAIAGELARKSLTQRGMRIPEGGVHGEAKLLAAPMAHGVECIEMVASMNVPSFEATEVPPGATFQSGKIEAKLRVVVPTHPMTRLEDELVMRSDAVLSMRGSVVRITVQSLSKTSYVPMAEARHDI